VIRSRSVIAPTTALGATTINTADLVSYLAKSKPIVIDTLWNYLDGSIPGAVGLTKSGLGGDYSDSAQNRLRIKMLELAKGDLSKPIVVVGWSSKRFDGYNLTQRLVALGYTKVYWYRGGRDAWEAHGLPKTKLDIQDQPNRQLFANCFKVVRRHVRAQGSLRS
jgi:adenylate cyclase